MHYCLSDYAHHAFNLAKKVISFICKDYGNECMSLISHHSTSRMLVSKTLVLYQAHVAIEYPFKTENYTDTHLGPTSYKWKQNTRCWDIEVKCPCFYFQIEKNTSVEVLVLTYVGSTFKFWCLLTLLWLAGNSKPKKSANRRKNK